MKSSSAINSYAKINFESEVLGASPHRLIAILFEGALRDINNAKVAIQNRQIAAKGVAIGRAISIIGDGLNGSLNMEAGGELAQNLHRLYDYMGLRLVEANLKNDIGILDEVTSLLNEVKEGWDGIRPK
jgi:flagellar protein FliS